MPFTQCGKARVERIDLAAGSGRVARPLEQPHSGGVRPPVGGFQRAVDQPPVHGQGLRRMGLLP